MSIGAGMVAGWISFQRKDGERMEKEPVAKSGGEEPAALDMAGLLARMGGKKELAGRMAQIYQRLHPEQIRVLRRVVAEGDAEALRLQAHTIKGGAGNVGGLALHAMAVQMEERAKAGRLEEARGLMPALERESARLLEALKTEFGAP